MALSNVLRSIFHQIGKLESNSIQHDLDGLPVEWPFSFDPNSNVFVLNR